MIAVIAGATGLTGLAIVQELERRPEITQILAPVRKLGRLSPDTQVKEILLPEGGYPELLRTGFATLQGDIYICALGTTHKKAGSKAAFRTVDYDAVVAFAQIAQQCGAPAFGLVSASGASRNSLVHYSRVKGEAEDAITGMAIPSQTIIRPSLLIGEREEERPAEHLSILAWKKLQAFLPQRLSRELGSEVHAVARILVDQCVQSKAGVHIIEAKEIH